MNISIIFEFNFSEEQNKSNNIIVFALNPKSVKTKLNKYSAIFFIKE